MNSIRTRSVAAAAAIDALRAMPRDGRDSSVSPIRLLLPEIAEAHAVLAADHPRLSLLSVTMADGSGFAEVRNSDTYGVVLSSERYPDNTDRVARLAAMATVAEKVLAGALR